MDLLSPSPTTNSTLTPVLGDNVQDLLGSYPLQVHPSSIITVNSVDDAVPSIPGVITLRDAINQANADDGEDMIVFDRSLFSTAQTITLNLGELDITHNLDIIAPRDSLTGRDLVTVSGNNASRVFDIEKEATVSLDGLIVTNGFVDENRGDGSGAGIRNSGILTLDNCHLSGNGGNSYALGGGIASSGTLTVNNTTISGNKSTGAGGILNRGILTLNNSQVRDNLGAQGGGGIVSSGTLTVNNSTISGNRVSTSYFVGGGISGSGNITISNSIISGNSAYTGGGIHYDGNNLTVSNSTISNNRAGDNGGGIWVNGNVVLSDSIISGNSTGFLGGGIYGDVIVSNSTISDNSAGYGGGIFGRGVVSNSTISNNRATSGGGIYHVRNDTFLVNNSTITGNSVTKDGGGIFNSNGTIALVSSTITQNLASNGSGVFNGADTLFNLISGEASARNTIIASNLKNENGINPDVFGTFTSNGYNLIGDSTGSTGFSATGDIVGTSDNPIDPRLAPLDFYGGPTQNFALLPDSPAIDAGDPTVLDTDPTTDQRGFPRVSGDRADIGAFEVQV